MEYKVPDFNKISLLARYNAETWDLMKGGQIQSLVPKNGFGKELPIVDGESTVYHCVSYGDAFLALAARLNGDFIVSDIRESAVKIVQLKATQPYARLAIVVRDLSNKLNIPPEKQSDLVQEVNRTLVQDAEQLRQRNITYLVGDSSYLDIPSKSVDWAFSYEPLLFGNLPFMVEMLASTRKGVILSFSEATRKDYNDLDLKQFEYFKNVLKEYGLTTQIIDGTFEAVGEGMQNVRYVIIGSEPFLAVNDRLVFKYCSENVFPMLEIPAHLDEYSAVSNAPKGPYPINIANAQSDMGLHPDNIMESLQRIDRMMRLAGCETPYSLVNIFE